MTTLSGVVGLHSNDRWYWQSHDPQHVGQTCVAPATSPELNVERRTFEPLKSSFRWMGPQPLLYKTFGINIMKGPKPPAWSYRPLIINRRRWGQHSRIVQHPTSTVHAIFALKSASFSPAPPLSSASKLISTSRAILKPLEVLMRLHASSFYPMSHRCNNPHHPLPHPRAFLPPSHPDADHL